MKKTIIRLCIALICVVVLALIVAFFSLNTMVKTGFETIGPRITKVPMHLGGAKVSPFSGTCQLTDLVVGNPEAFKTPSAIKVGDVKVAVKIGSVLSDVIQVDSVNIQAPEITFEGSFTGSNLGKILDNLKTSSSSEAKNAAQPTGEAKKEKNIFIKDLVITDAKVNVSVTALGGKVIPVPLPPIHLQNIGTQDKGVTMAEASSQIMQAILSSATQASETAVTSFRKSLIEIGGGAKGEANKAVEGIKGLFKK